MTTTLPVPSPTANGLASMTRDQVDLIRRTIAKGCSDDELALFIHVAQRSGLDPMAKQVYAIKRGQNMTIQTGIDGFRVVAARTGQHAGTDDAVYEEEDGRPIKATVTVYRMVAGQRVAFSASARFAEYNAGQGLWTKMPYTMLGKCAEALALRKAFPADLSGLYATEEMAQADVRPAVQSPASSPRKEAEKRIADALKDALLEPVVRAEIERAGHKGKTLKTLTDAQIVDLDSAIEAALAQEFASAPPSGD